MFDGYNGKMRSDDIAGTLTQEIGNPNERHSQKAVLPIEIKVMGTLDPKRHSQMDVHDGGGVMSCLDDISEKKKVGIPIPREPEDPSG